MKFFKRIALCLLIFSPLISGCGNSAPKEDEDLITVKFNALSDISIYPIEDKVLENPRKIIPPTVTIKDQSTNPDGLIVSGWYKDAALINQWDFKNEIVSKNMTLYAKWEKQIKVNYYLERSFDKSNEPLGTELLFVNQGLVDRDDLYNGYDFLGYYLDPDFKESSRIEIGTPLTDNTNVYIKRSDSIYFNAKALANRFDTGRAAAGSGSTEPFMELKTDKNGEQVYQVNFGYSTSADPYVYCFNPTFDIEHTKILQVKFRNLGGSNSLKFYWTAKDKDGQWTDAQSYIETSALGYSLGSNMQYMSEDDDWAVANFYVARDVTKNGYSTWGIANQLVTLRIQSSYVSKNKDDLSNVIQIKEIRGFDSDEYLKNVDTQKVIDITKNDSEEELHEKSQQQQSIKGFIFPKNYNCVDLSGDQTTSNSTFNRVSGLLMHGNFGQGEIKARLNYTANEALSLDDYTTIKIRLKNYGYIPSLRISFENEQQRACQTSIGLKKQMNEVVEFEINMFSVHSFYTKSLRSIELAFNTTGVDNAILIESVEFLRYKPIPIHGINFNDKECAGFVSDEKCSVSYNSGYKATTFNVTNPDKIFTKTFDTFSIDGYKELSLSFLTSDPSSLISKFIVKVNIKDNISDTYEFDISFVKNTIQTKKVALKHVGYLSSIDVSFAGTGTVNIKELRFETNDTSFDFQNDQYFSKMMPGQWYDGESYDYSLNALKIGNGNTLWCYAGGGGYTGLENFPLRGTTRLVVIYQNRTNYVHIYAGLGCGPASAVKPDVGVNAYPSSPNCSGQVELDVMTNMGENEWASTYFEFKNTPMKNISQTDFQNYVCYMAALYYSFNLYIRAVIIC